MDKYFVKGGQKLFGAVEIPSAKNACLPILAGSILCDGKVTLEKMPAFIDVQNMLKILESLGGKITYKGLSICLDMTGLNRYDIAFRLSSPIRSSIFCMGALLGRFKKARVAYPGGCDIGERPIDLHFKALRALNVKITDRHGQIFCDGTHMKAGDIHLDFPSVGATENVLMAAVTLQGTTKIFGAAEEPEIVDLANFLIAAGARIKGAGTSVLVIEGVKTLKNVTYRPLPDRIIAGTYILASAICGGEIILKNCPHESLGALISNLDPLCPRISVQGDNLIVSSCGTPKAISKIQTQPYPGFPTDLQPQLVSMLATARGTSVVVENLFENRFKYVAQLTKMGAEITLSGRSAIIHGTPHLYGAEVYAPDLRAGAALVLAGLGARGYTTISNIGQIERGYDNLAENFSALGADIKKI